MAYNTILLKGDFGRRYDEKRADGAITPGMIVETTSAGKWKAHQVRGGRWTRAVAVEDAFSGLDLVNTKGNTIDDAYADGNLVRGLYLSPGDKFYALLHAVENVAIGDWAISYGDGTVAKAATAFLANTVAASTALSGTAAETTFSNGSVTIPKNSLKVGDVIRIRSQGILTATTSTDTLLVKVYIGTDALVSAQGPDATNGDEWLIDCTVTIRTIGASGTYVASGYQSIGVPGTATLKPFLLGSTTIDTTADATITVKGTWSTSSGSDSARQDSLMVEHVKAGSSAENGSAGGDVIGTFDTAVDNSLGVASARVVVEVR